MPPGFDPPHPGGMAHNSPTFQRWGREFRGAQVPKGRLKPCAIRQPSLRDLSDYGGGFPTLKHWAIVACPSGTMTWPGFAGILWDQILAALGRIHPGAWRSSVANATRRSWANSFPWAEAVRLPSAHRYAMPARGGYQRSYIPTHIPKAPIPQN